MNGRQISVPRRKSNRRRVAAVTTANASNTPVQIGVVANRTIIGRKAVARRAVAKRVVAKKAVARKAVAKKAFVEKAFVRKAFVRKAFARKAFARKTFVKTAVVKTTASPKSTAKPMMTAVIATETTSRRFRGKALPIAKTIAVPASRITKSHAGSAPFNPVASGRTFINIVMKATWADRIMNRRCSNR